jgi:hypothetical protein
MGQNEFVVRCDLLFLCVQHSESACPISVVILIADFHFAACEQRFIALGRHVRPLVHLTARLTGFEQDATVVLDPERDHFLLGGLQNIDR